MRAMIKPRAASWIFILSAGLALGLGCKKGEGGVPTSRKNLPPKILEINLQPSAPAAGQDLTAAVEYNDPEEDQVVLEYRWSVNDRAVQEGGTSSLPGSLVTSGAAIKLEVRARDQVNIGEWTAGPAVKVGAAMQGKIQGVSLEPAEAFKGTTLSVKVDWGDLDADSLELFYRWQVNGQRIEDAAESSLSGDSFRHDDRVMVEVSPDSEFPSRQVWRAETRIRNTAPEIKSELDFVQEGDRLVYQLEAEDADGDPLTFILEKGPAGMTIDPKTGLASWQPGPNATGAFPVQMKVDDGFGGRAGQAGELNLQTPAPAR